MDAFFERDENADFKRIIRELQRPFDCHGAASPFQSQQTEGAAASSGSSNRGSVAADAATQHGLADSVSYEQRLADCTTDLQIYVKEAYCLDFCETAELWSHSPFTFDAISLLDEYVDYIRKVAAAEHHKELITAVRVGTILFPTFVGLREAYIIRCQGFDEDERKYLGMLSDIEDRMKNTYFDADEKITQFVSSLRNEYETINRMEVMAEMNISDRDWFMKRRAKYCDVHEKSMQAAYETLLIASGIFENRCLFKTSNTDSTEPVAFTLNREFQKVESIVVMVRCILDRQIDVLEEKQTKTNALLSEISKGHQ